MDVDDKVVDRIFSELDSHSSQLLELSKIVHSNAAILGIIAKLVIGIITFIIITSIGALYNHLSTKDDPKAPVLYHRETVIDTRNSIPDLDKDKKGN